MTAPRPRTRQPKQLDAGILQAEISSLCTWPPGTSPPRRSAPTPRRFGGSPPPTCCSRTAGTPGSNPDGRDIQQWMSWLLDRYSSAYASNQYRALQQFFKLLAAEDELPDPMAGLPPPPVPQQLIPVFTSQELARLDQACAGRSFAQRRDTAIIAVFKATGIRLAGIRYSPGDPRRGDIDLWQREITRPRQGRHGPDRQDRPPGSPQPRPVPAAPDPARPGLAAPAVARGRQLGAADRRRHLPDDHPPRPPVRRGRLSAPVPAPLQPHLARPRRTPKET